MSKKTICIIGGFAAALGSLFYLYKRMTLSRDRKSLLEAIRLKELGNELYMSEQYSGALERYYPAISMVRKRSKEYMHILHNISLCHAKQKEHEKVVEITSRVISEHLGSTNALKMRYWAHKHLGKKESALIDILILKLFVTNSREVNKCSNIINKLLCDISMDKESAWKKDRRLPPSIQVYDSFFYTLPGLYSKASSPVLSLLTEKNYGKLKAYIEDKSTAESIFLIGCFAYLDGEHPLSIKILENGRCLYSRLICEFVKSESGYQINQKNIEDIKNRNPTICYYKALTYRNIGMLEKYGFYITQALSFESCSFVYAHNIEVLLVENRKEKVEEVLERAVSLFPNDPYILCLCADFFISIRRYKRSKFYIEKLSLYKNNPRVFCVIGRFFDQYNEKDKARDYYKKAIEIDHFYFEALVNLGCNLLTRCNFSSIEYFERSVQSGRNKPQKMNSLKMLELSKAVRRITKEYPETISLFNR